MIPEQKFGNQYLKMAASGCTYVSNFSSVNSTSAVKTGKPICSVSCPNFFGPKLGNPNTTLKSYSLKISHKQSRTLKRLVLVPVAQCLVNDNSEAISGLAQFSNSNGSGQEVAIDVKLPRRSLLVQFTCNVCTVRSQKLINRLAYEKGTVFIQCSGCSQYHKLVDNLDLVVEYDFQEDVGPGCRGNVT